MSDLLHAMSYEIHGEEELDRWEREHDFKVRWACPACDYEYEAPRDTNERLKCPTCGERCERAGESYRA